MKCKFCLMAIEKTEKYFSIAPREPYGTPSYGAIQTNNCCNECMTKFTNNQPERSKREDHILIYKDENGNKTPIRDLFNDNYGCGTLNS